MEDLTYLVMGGFEVLKPNNWLLNFFKAIVQFIVYTIIFLSKFLARILVIFWQIYC